MSKWTRLFQSRLTNKQTKKLKTKEFEEKKGLSFGFREKEKGKTVRRQGKIEDLEKKPVNGLGFFSKCPGLFGKKTPWINSL